jgi:hypothetical protein
MTMDRLQRAAILTRLIEQLRENGSWCGETHLQKATFILQTLMEVPLSFEFILYKHGPFSFDLRNELTGLRADDLVTLEPQWPYGPRIVTTNRTTNIQRLYSKTLARYKGEIDFVAEILGEKDVSELERLATAFYISVRSPEGTSADERADKLTELKPHVPRDLAVIAINDADQIADAARRRLQ